MIKIAGTTVNAVVQGNQVAVRGYKGPLTSLSIDGVSKRILRHNPSPYVPGVVVLTFED